MKKLIKILSVCLCFIAYSVALTTLNACGGSCDNGEQNPPVYQANQIEYYTLPDSFLVNIQMASSSFEIVKYDGSYYFTEQIGVIKTEKALIKTGDTYTLYGKALNDSFDYVWTAIKEDIASDQVGFEAYTLIQPILVDTKGLESTDYTMTVGDNQVACKKYTYTLQGSTGEYAVPTGYMFWIGLESSGISAAATSYQTNLTALPAHLAGIVG